MRRTSGPPISLMALLWLVAVAVVSCGDGDPATPTSEFRFNLSVRDTLGNPVPDLEVSVWNFLSLGWPGPVAAKSGPTDGPASTASTTIWFVLANVAVVDVDILDLNGKPIDHLLTGEKRPSGLHSIFWSPEGGVPNGVYRYHVVASDTLTGDVLFEGERYCVMSKQERSDQVIGYTNSNGDFGTDNELLFPGHLNLPTFIATNEQGEEVSTFDVLDSVQITVVDTVNGVGLQVNRVVRSGVNSFHLVWKEPSLPPFVALMPPGVSEFSPSDDSFLHSRDEALEWHLGQNYPNPFW